MDETLLKANQNFALNEEVSCDKGEEYTVRGFRSTRGQVMSKYSETFDFGDGS